VEHSRECRGAGEGKTGATESVDSKNTSPKRDELSWQRRRKDGRDGRRRRELVPTHSDGGLGATITWMNSSDDDGHWEKGNKSKTRGGPESPTWKRKGERNDQKKTVERCYRTI